MQQKVAIASALVADPPIILLDEPTLGLDVQAAKIVEEWIEKLAHQQNKTVLVTTHQLDMAGKVSDRVAIIQKGALIADKPVAELLKLFQLNTYDIRLEGVIEQNRLPWSDGLTLSQGDDETTTISGIPYHNALYDGLEKLHSTAIPLRNITRAPPDLDEALLHLLAKYRRG